ncbi:hypothetical protein E2542_SST24012 [Spatholobus suberectus]|nr:hypothetical protein E2542_SST24012 [Spatholobus suberectus]
MVVRNQSSEVREHGKGPRRASKPGPTHLITGYANGVGKSFRRGAFLLHHHNRRLLATCHSVLNPLLSNHFHLKRVANGTAHLPLGQILTSSNKIKTELGLPSRMIPPPLTRTGSGTLLRRRFRAKSTYNDLHRTTSSFTESETPP